MNPATPMIAKMKKASLFLTILLFIFGCKNESVENKKISFSDSTRQIENTIASIDTAEVLKNDSIITLVWEKTFDRHKLGFLNTGDSIEKSLKLIENLFDVEYVLIEDTFADEVYEDYTVRDNTGTTIFKIYPGVEENGLADRIQHFELYDPSYSCQFGFFIGMTVSELKKTYALTQAYFNYDDGLLLYNDVMDFIFLLNVDSYSRVKKFDYENPTIDSVPDQAIIERINIL